MILKIDNLNKSIGLKELFENLSVTINEGEKIALIGRNGLGKTTLFKIITGEDKDFTGNVELLRGLKIILTKQEHFFNEATTPLEYILQDVPEFYELKEKINNYQNNPDHSLEKIEEYTDAITKFSELGYFQIEDEIVEALRSFQIDEEQALGEMKTLSGGEKRFVELVRVMFSGADIALIDEPTNHMDYVGKERFIKWFNEFKKTIIVITHDRDVLKHVNRILELKDKKISVFNGDYDNFIKQNNLATITGIEGYEGGLKNIDKLKKQMIEARIAKLSAKSNKGRIAAKIREERFARELEKQKGELEKPSFWIDQETLEQTDERIIEKYQKYKEKNIGISNSNLSEYKKELLNIKNLSVGYDKPLFDKIMIEMFHGDKLFIKGRNGAGKSTLVKTVIRNINSLEPSENNTTVPSQIKLFNGQFKISPKIRLGIYEQEIDARFLNMTLSQAVEQIYYDLRHPINSQKVNSVLGRYLFDPMTDANLTFDKLSGGQKARFQLIKMLANNPNLLILDEPTNHLDLPSIEELENALLSFNGAMIYISHDNYFINKLGGNVIEL